MKSFPIRNQKIGYAYSFKVFLFKRFTIIKLLQKLLLDDDDIYFDSSLPTKILIIITYLKKLFSKL